MTGKYMLYVDTTVAPVHPSRESFGLDMALNARLTCSYFANLDMPGCLSFVPKGS